MMNTAGISFSGLTFHPFTEQDIKILTPIMKRAFDEDIKIHTGQNEGGPEGYDNGEIMRKWYLHEDSTSFKILKEGEIIGGLCVFIRKNKINYLANVFIDPELHSQGIGMVVWEYIEHRYPDTIKWQTDTIAYSRRNHHFYVNKCGFKIIHIKNPKASLTNTDEPCLYLMEKEMGAR